jgi:hypothetical protein
MEQDQQVQEQQHEDLKMPKLKFNDSFETGSQEGHENQVCRGSTTIYKMN